jgi:hypothetical protein
MDKDEKLMQVLSGLLAEVELAQSRGDVALEMRLERISRTMLSVIWSGTETAAENSKICMSAG